MIMYSSFINPFSLRGTPLDPFPFIESLTEVELCMLSQLVNFPFLERRALLPNTAFLPLSHTIDEQPAGWPPKSLRNRCIRLGLLTPWTDKEEAPLRFTRTGLALAVAIWKRWSTPREHLGWFSLRSTSGVEPSSFLGLRLRNACYRYYPTSFVIVENTATSNKKPYWYTSITTFRNEGNKTLAIHYGEKGWDAPPPLDKQQFEIEALTWAD